MSKPVVIVALVTLAAGTVLAHERAHGLVAERMAAMKNMGQELKAIGEMLLGRVSFDAVAVHQHADALHENCHKVERMFPPGSIGHQSRAKPTIWEQPETFQNEMRRLHEASERLSVIAASGDKQKLIPVFEEVGATCKSCHETFRLPED